MRLDPPTLLLASFATTSLVGALFLLSWRQAPASRALALWGAAHLLGASGSGLLALRGRIPDPVSIGLANAAILAAFGLLWMGVRAFEGRALRPGRALAAAAGWCLLCLVPAFYGTIEARVVYCSGAAGLICLAAAADLRRGRARRLASRATAVGLLGLHGGFYLARIPASLLFPAAAGVPLFDSPWVPILCLTAMLFSIAAAFTFMALIKEQAEREQHAAARTDPLTGLANRRAFFESAGRLFDGRTPCALVLLDLDHFKRVNDGYGHAAGDAALVAFAHLAAALTPPGTHLGRLGGEEFACLLPGTTPAAARAAAEGLRAAFARLRVPELPELRLSVSAGVAVQGPEIPDIDALMRAADAALYRAKAGGRDRVAVDGAPLLRAA